MRILIVLTYYRPHASGLTIYAQRLAKALVRRGHQVTVLTSQYAKDLAREEMDEGVLVVRVPVAFRVSKGVIMPLFGITATRLVAEHDWIQLHLPQFDAAGVALRGRLLKKPTIITYHCDLRMPPGVLSWIANQAIHLMNELAAKFAHRIVTNTRDYAEHSPYLRRYLEKVRIISPPIVQPPVNSADSASFSRRINPEDWHPVIGLASRFATEKGIEILLDALPAILSEYPLSMVQFVGAYREVVGEEGYFDRLSPRIQEFEKSGNWKFLGLIPDGEMPAFYANLDVLVLPSLNSTESFGFVQIEAMINGTPVVVSNLPGVRQPVLTHGMGRIFPVGDPAGLAEGVIQILRNRAEYVRDPQPIKNTYLPDSAAGAYEEVFKEISAELQNRGKR